MKHTKTLLIVILTGIGVILSLILYLQWNDYQEKKNREIETFTNSFATRHLEIVTTKEDIVGFTIGLMDFEHANDFSSFTTVDELMNEFLELEMVEPFTYIHKIEDYKKYETMFSRIREVIAKIAFYDKDSIFSSQEGNDEIVSLGNRRYQCQIQKNMLSKENWEELFLRYQKKRGLKKNFYQESLWKNPYIQVLLKEETITQEMWYQNFEQLYEKLYSKMEDYITLILTNLITDFCEYILEEEQYKSIALDTLLITYEFQWTTHYIPNLNGMGKVYETKLNITDIYNLLDSRKYPKLYL